MERREHQGQNSLLKIVFPVLFGKFPVLKIVFPCSLQGIPYFF
jgi:hypothetical protein